MSPVRHRMCMHWKLCVNEALLCNITVTSSMGDLVSDGSLTKVAGEVKCRETTTHISWLMRNPVSTTAEGWPVTPIRSPTKTMYDLGIVSGLNVSATPFTVPSPLVRPPKVWLLEVLLRMYLHDLGDITQCFNQVLPRAVTQSVSIGLPVNRQVVEQCIICMVGMANALP